MKTKIGKILAWAFVLLAFAQVTQAAVNLVMTVAPESPRRTAFQANDGYRTVSVYRIANAGDTTGRLDGLSIKRNGLASVILEIDEVIYSTNENDSPSNGDVSININPSLSIQAGKYITVIIRGLCSPESTDISAKISGIGGLFNETSFAQTLPATHAFVDVLPAQGVRNMSVRSTVSPNQSTILGFIVEGDKNQGYPVLVRAVGPGLAAFRVTNTLLDPYIKLFDKSGRVIAENDDWEGMEDVFAQAGAFPLRKGSYDSGMLVYLMPGSYTVNIKGFGTGQGEVLLEIYQLKSSDIGKG